MNKYPIYRLYPKIKKYPNLLHQIAGACRKVWNDFLAQNKLELEKYQQGKETVTVVE